MTAFYVFTAWCLGVLNKIKTNEAQRKVSPAINSLTSYRNTAFVLHDASVTKVTKHIINFLNSFLQ